MNSISLGNIQIYGDLAMRTLLNYSRLESIWYRPEKVFVADQANWPGDWEGRAILALTMLGQTTKREPAYLDEIMRLLPKHFNSKEYLGEIYPEGIISEQQLSGHSWLLRGLIEFYLWKKDESVLQMIKSIVNNLLLPARNHYKEYPALPKDREYDKIQLKGEAMGKLTGTLINNWYTSTDIGCAFIMLDGATQAYELLKLPELEELIKEMLEKFFQIDLLGISIQTHATLSGLRGALRYYELKGNNELLEQIIHFYDIYRTEGMTENYSNYNWFNRPEWTEPCAIVDSYIVSFQLWKHTKNERYLEDAHNIYFNGLGYAQRPNGGFGCDTCLGDNQYLNGQEGIYEAYWCCTMRGSDGLANVSKNIALYNEDSIVLPFYFDSNFELKSKEGFIECKEHTQYPYHGNVELEIIKTNIIGEKNIQFYIPSWVPENSIKVLVNGKCQSVCVEEGFVQVTVSVEEGLKISIQFPLSLRVEKMQNKNTPSDYKKYFHGGLLLGYDNSSLPISIDCTGSFQYLEHGKYIYNNEIVLEPIRHILDELPDIAKQNRKQVLFK